MRILKKQDVFEDFRVHPFTFLPIMKRISRVVLHKNGSL